MTMIFVKRSGIGTPRRRRQLRLGPALPTTVVIQVRPCAELGHAAGNGSTGNWTRRDFPRRRCSRASVVATRPWSRTSIRRDRARPRLRGRHRRARSAERVGPTGKVYGLDMTEEMLALASRIVTWAGATNVEFFKGYIEDIPVRQQPRRRHLELCHQPVDQQVPRVRGDVPSASSGRPHRHQRRRGRQRAHRVATRRAGNLRRLCRRLAVIRGVRSGAPGRGVRGDRHHAYNRVPTRDPLGDRAGDKVVSCRTICAHGSGACAEDLLLTA